MKTLDVLASFSLLRKHGIPSAKFEKAASAEEAAAAAARIGFPVVMKIISEKYTHKTDVGGVILNLRGADAVREAYSRLSALSPQVLVQQQAEGTETIVGVKKDNVFGQTILFGLGGVFVEVYRDVAFRLCPVSREHALEMIKETKASKILAGFRGTKPANLDSLAELIVAVSKMAAAEKNLLELDLNPVMAGETALAADARAVFE